MARFKEGFKSGKAGISLEQLESCGFSKQNINSLERLFPTASLAQDFGNGVFLLTDSYGTPLCIASIIDSTQGRKGDILKGKGVAELHDKLTKDVETLAANADAKIPLFIQYSPEKASFFKWFFSKNRELFEARPTKKEAAKSAEILKEVISAYGLANRVYAYRFDGTVISEPVVRGRVPLPPMPEVHKLRQEQVPLPPMPEAPKLQTLMEEDEIPTANVQLPHPALKALFDLNSEVLVSVNPSRYDAKDTHVIIGRRLAKYGVDAIADSAAYDSLKSFVFEGSRLCRISPVLAVALAKDAEIASKINVPLPGGKTETLDRFAERVPNLLVALKEEKVKEVSGLPVLTLEAFDTIFYKLRGVDSTLTQYHVLSGLFIGLAMGIEEKKDKFGANRNRVRAEFAEFEKRRLKQMRDEAVAENDKMRVGIIDMLLRDPSQARGVNEVIDVPKGDPAMRGLEDLTSDWNGRSLQSVIDTAGGSTSKVARRVLDKNGAEIMWLSEQQFNAMAAMMRASEGQKPYFLEQAGVGVSFKVEGDNTLHRAFIAIDFTCSPDGVSPPGFVDVSKIVSRIPAKGRITEIALEFTMHTHPPIQNYDVPSALDLNPARGLAAVLRIMVGSDTAKFCGSGKSYTATVFSDRGASLVTITDSLKAYFISHNGQVLGFNHPGDVSKFASNLKAAGFDMQGKAALTPLGDPASILYSRLELVQ